MKRLATVCAAFAALALCQACRRPTPPPSAIELAPPPPPSGDGSIVQLMSREEVALNGPRVDARPGDWMIRGPAGVAIISQRRGAVIDFGAEGGDDALVSLEPTVFEGLDEATSVVESVEPAGAGSYALLVRRRILTDPPLRLWTYVSEKDGALRIESVATAQDEGALAVTLGEVVAWGNVPTWVEGHGFARDAGTLNGDFIAREGLGVGYALENEDGRIAARFGKPQPGFHEWPRTGEVLEGVPAHGASRRRVVTLTQAAGALGAAVAKLPRVAKSIARTPLPRGAPAGTWAEARRCNGASADSLAGGNPAAGGTAGLFARFDATAEDVALPAAPAGGGAGPACWELRFTAAGHAPGAWTPASAIAGAPWPAAGALRWRIREQGASVVPARIVARGIGGTPDPWWGEEPHEGAALDAVHADRDGEIAIPPGRYHVTVTRGFEYTAYDADVTVAAGQTTDVEATLDRVVDTRGWISADLHVHAVPSPDAPVPLAERVLSLAASGVEVAVATDHNAVTDYGPTIRERGLGTWLASVVGDEVTTRGTPLGHFNVFPLAAGSPPIVYEKVTPQALVAAARAAPGGASAPGPDGGETAAPKIVQLNHPRMGSIGYLELLHFDPGDVAAWRARSPLAEMGFDAVEIFNGDHYADIPAVEKVMSDWYALLDAGLHLTATGNSDSHKVTYHECGTPRNLVRIANDDPARLDPRALVDAIVGGHVVVSSGLLVRIESGGAGPGAGGKGPLPPVGPGDSVPAGAVSIRVTVDAPPWVDVSRVDLVSHGRVVQTWASGFRAGVRRLDATFATTMAPGDWILAVARGDKPMAFLERPGAKPFGFTNPIWAK